MDLLTPSSPGVFQLCLWPLTAPGYLGEGCHASHQPSDASTSVTDIIQCYKNERRRQQHWPTRFFMISANSATVCSSGLPMLTGRLKLLFIRETRPSTRSVTYWKDRVCLPSPYICYIDHKTEIIFFLSNSRPVLSVENTGQRSSVC